MQRRPSHSIHFRDDLSEYSCPSTWGDRPGPLHLGDHRIVPEGLQARRTVGEALLRAEMERQREERLEKYADRCSCLGARTARHLMDAFQRIPQQPSLIFAWTEVQSILLLPCDEKGPYLICIATFRRGDGLSEWVLQAGSLRGRSRWGIEMMAALLRERKASSPVCCSGPRREGGSLSLSLFMDMARIACEVARLRPSATTMDRLVEALDLLAETQRPPGGAPMVDRGVGGLSAAAAEMLPAPHFPLASLRRFGDTVRRASADFTEWRRWREVSRLLREPPGWDPHVWRNNVLPFLWPSDPTLRDNKSAEYPAAVDHQLTSAAERWRKTLS